MNPEAPSFERLPATPERSGLADLYIPKQAGAQILAAEMVREVSVDVLSPDEMFRADIERYMHRDMTERTGTEVQVHGETIPRRPCIEVHVDAETTQAVSEGLWRERMGIGIATNAFNRLQSYIPETGVDMDNVPAAQGAPETLIQTVSERYAAWSAREDEKHASPAPVTDSWDWDAPEDNSPTEDEQPVNAIRYATKSLSDRSFQPSTELSGKETGEELVDVRFAILDECRAVLADLDDINAHNISAIETGNWPEQEIFAKVKHDVELQQFRNPDSKLEDVIAGSLRREIGQLLPTNTQVKNEYDSYKLRVGQLFGQDFLQKVGAMRYDFDPEPELGNNRSLGLLQDLYISKEDLAAREALRQSIAEFEDRCKPLATNSEYFTEDKAVDRITHFLQRVVPGDMPLFHATGPEEAAKIMSKGVLTTHQGALQDGHRPDAQGVHSNYIHWGDPGRTIGGYMKYDSGMLLAMPAGAVIEATPIFRPEDYIAGPQEANTAVPYAEVSFGDDVPHALQERLAQMQARKAEGVMSVVSNGNFSNMSFVPKEEGQWTNYGYSVQDAYMFVNPAYREAYAQQLRNLGHDEAWIADHVVAGTGSNEESLSIAKSLMGTSYEGVGEAYQGRFFAPVTQHYVGYSERDHWNDTNDMQLQVSAANYARTA